MPGGSLPTTPITNPSVGHSLISGFAAQRLPNGRHLLGNLQPHICDPSQLGFDLLVPGFEHGRVGRLHRLIEIATNAEQLHPDRRKLGRQTVIDPPLRPICRRTSALIQRARSVDRWAARWVFPFGGLADGASATGSNFSLCIKRADVFAGR